MEQFSCGVDQSAAGDGGCHLMIGGNYVHLAPPARRCHKIVLWILLMNPAQALYAEQGQNGAPIHQCADKEQDRERTFGP